MNYEFRETVVLNAFTRSKGQCECTEGGCAAGHYVRCHQVFKYADRAISDQRFGWQAHHGIPVSEGGVPILANCEILCVDCHDARHGKLLGKLFGKP
jgi:5-methylcytosine-specific restriction endonuclease McrA